MESNVISDVLGAIVSKLYEWGDDEDWIEITVIRRGDLVGIEVTVPFGGIRLMKRMTAMKHEIEMVRFKDIIIEGWVDEITRDIEKAKKDNED